MAVEVVWAPDVSRELPRVLTLRPCDVEAMALRLFGAGPEIARQVRGLQQFVGEGGWSDEALLAEHRRSVQESLGEEDGVLILDGSDVAKQGNWAWTSMNCASTGAGITT